VDEIVAAKARDQVALALPVDEVSAVRPDEGVVAVRAANDVERPDPVSVERGLNA
jgi:hypothetical protein